MKRYKIEEIENRWLDPYVVLPPLGVLLLVATSQNRLVQDAVFCDKNEFRFVGSSVAISNVLYWRLRPTNPLRASNEEYIDLQTPGNTK